MSIVAWSISSCTALSGTPFITRCEAKVCRNTCQLILRRAARIHRHPPATLFLRAPDEAPSAIDVAVLAVDLDAGEPLSERSRRVESRSDHDVPARIDVAPLVADLDQRETLACVVVEVVERRLDQPIAVRADHAALALVLHPG